MDQERYSEESEHLREQLFAAKSGSDTVLFSSIPQDVCIDTVQSVGSNSYLKGLVQQFSTCVSQSLWGSNNSYQVACILGIYITINKQNYSYEVAIVVLWLGVISA